jgi:hypothetical protein
MLLLGGGVARCCLSVLLGLIMVTRPIKQRCCVAMPRGGCHICRSGTLSC